MYRMCLLQFTDNVYKCLEKTNYVVGVFIDLSKAFDSQDQNILLHMLEYMGVPLKLFQYYLSNRKRCVHSDKNSPQVN